MGADWTSFWERSDLGSSDAAEDVFARYSHQLIELAGQNIHPALLKRFDGEDVVQSVFRTFFRRQEQGMFDIQHSQQLWKLLVTITLCKTRSMARRHTAERRNANIEQESPRESTFVDQSARPEDALALWEEIDFLVQGLPDKTGQILSGRLEGRSKSEIARELSLSRQSVHRILNLVEERLSQRFEQISNDF